MQFDNFIKFLKKKGKKEHVIQGLVDYVREFEEYLKKKNNALNATTPEILNKYINLIQSHPGINIKNRLRAISLYFRLIGNSELAGLASRLREQRILKTRTSTALKEFPGLNPEYLRALADFGIRNTEQMRKHASSPSQREKLAREVDVPLKTIVEIVKLSNLSRLRGVKGIRARLYYDAGFDTIEKLAASEPEKSLKKLKKFVEKTGFDGIAPLPKEIASTIEQAKKIRKVVKY